MLAASKGCELNSKIWLDGDSFEAMKAVLEADCEIAKKNCVDTKGFELDNTSETAEVGGKRHVKEGAKFKDIYMNYDITETPIFGEIFGKLGFTLNNKVFAPDLAQPAWNKMNAMGVNKWGSRAGYLFAAGEGLMKGLSDNFNLGKATVDYAASLKTINDLGKDRLVAAKAALKDEIAKSSSDLAFKAAKEAELAAIEGAQEDLAVTYARASVAFIKSDAAKSELPKMLTAMGLDEETAMIVYSIAPAYTEAGAPLDELCVIAAVEKLVENCSISRSWGNAIIAFKKIVDISAAIQKASESEGVKAVDAKIAEFEAQAAMIPQAQRNQMEMALAVEKARALKDALGAEKAAELIASFEKATALLGDRSQLTSAQSALVQDFAPAVGNLTIYMMVFAHDTGEGAKAPSKGADTNTGKAKTATGGATKKSGGSGKPDAGKSAGTTDKSGKSAKADAGKSTKTDCKKFKGKDLHWLNSETSKLSTTEEKRAFRLKYNECN